MKMSKDCWVPKWSFLNLGVSWILNIHLFVLPQVWCCQSASLRSDEWILQAQQKSRMWGQWFIFRHSLSIAMVRLRETTHLGIEWLNIEPNSTYSAHVKKRTDWGSQSTCPTFMLKAQVTMVHCFLIQIRRQSHDGKWSHRWDVNPCCIQAHLNRSLKLISWKYLLETSASELQWTFNLDGTVH